MPTDPANELPPQFVPPVIPALAAPPVLPAALEAQTLPVDSRLLKCYRMWCSMFICLYLGFLVYGIMVVQGQAEPTLDLVTDLATLHNPVARAAALEEKRHDAVGGIIVAIIAIAFYLTALLVPRKPWGWYLGFIAILSSVFPFVITAAGAIPLAVAWNKLPTKRHFGLAPLPPT
jgi:hypothetical protein